MLNHTTSCQTTLITRANASLFDGHAQTTCGTVPHMKLNRMPPKIGLALAAPLLFLMVVEACLRLFNIGYSASFLVPAEVNDRTVWTSNPFYGYRFFPHRAARNPASLLIDRQKPDDLYRIVVLGESAAMGDPAIEFSMARALEKSLNEPGQPRRFEVINAAMTAINSPVIVDIAGDMLKCEPDMFVIYMGNNEVVGPYGPGTAITKGNWLPSLTPLRVRATRLRLASVMGTIGQSGEPSSAWQGMEMFDQHRITYDDERLDDMYRLYASNLDRIIGMAGKRNIPVILCTVAVNLSDCAPFGSTNRVDLTGKSRRDWNSLFRDGRVAHSRKNIEEAKFRYEQALKHDEYHAELNYRLAVVLKELGQQDEANRRFALARDLDTQRFRTDSRINRIIRDIASRHSNVKLADVESAFHERDHRLMFVDHVHFSLPGLHAVVYEVCRSIGQIRTDIPDMIDEETLYDRLFRTPWSDRKIAAIMLARRDRPPFTTQWGNKEQMDRLRVVQDRAAGKINADATESTRTRYLEAVTMYPHDIYYHSQWGHILSSENNWADAAVVLTKATPNCPGFSDVHGLTALTLTMNGDVRSAVDTLFRTGPPYGFYLADAAVNIANGLRANNREETAHEFLAEILNRSKRFPGRSQIATALKK